MSRDASRAAHSTGGVNLANMAYRTILEMILDRRIPSGEIIVEDRLASALSISRTPIREALVRLESEKLVRKEANRPYRVRKVSNEEYFQAMRVREILEGEAVAQAVGRIDEARLRGVGAEIARLAATKRVVAEEHWAADEALHNLIADASGNQVLSGIIRELRVTTRMFELSGLPARLRPDCAEHLAIVEAIRSGDPEQARASMRTHIHSLSTDVLRLIANV